jgi:anti-sigma factor RsiW
VNAALNVRDYACAKVRRRLDSYLAGELSVDLSHEILEHLDRCPECAAELKARENLRGAVRRIAGATPEPREGFEAEVRARLARTPAPATGNVTSLLLAASLVAAAGAGTLFLLSRMSGPPGTNMAAAHDAKAFLFAALNHKNCALRFDKWSKAPSVSAAEIGLKLDPGLKAAAAEAAGRLPGYEAVTAHECSHAGEKVFHIVYRKSGSTSKKDLVSVLATRPGSTLAAEVRLAGLVSGGDRDGLAVVGTSARDGRLVFLVTDGNDEEAMRFGALVLPALATAFAAP